MSVSVCVSVFVSVSVSMSVSVSVSVSASVSVSVSARESPMKLDKCIIVSDGSTAEATLNFPVKNEDNV